MKNINQLENEKKEVLLNMNHEEIIAYFDNIVKKQYENYPKLTEEGFSNFNFREYLRLEEIIDESSKILSSKYNHVEILAYLSKLIELTDLYDENLKSGKELLFKIFLIDILNNVKAIESGLEFLQEHLTLYYLRYFFKIHDVIELLEIANVPEGVKEEVHVLLKEKNPELFETPIEDTFNIFIESIVKKLDEDINKFKRYSKTELDVERFEDSFKEIVENISYLIGYGNFLLEVYDDLKLNPFIQGNKIVIEEYVSLVFEENISDLDSFEESLTDEEDIRIFNCLKEGFSSDVPKYDFKEFKLIIPEGVESEDE
jgi:hypothetical protein